MTASTLLPAAEPFYFGPAERPLFGWYHGTASPRGPGVVLCSALGLDGTRGYWSYRHLAERLSAAGLAVLRFDWHGTGDSSGDDRDPDRVATWLADLDLAIEELKRRSGTTRPALVGLRAGATLAAHTAGARNDISAVVLWIPALTGATWVAEMAKLHKLYLRIVPQAGAAEPGGEEMLGSFAADQTIAALAKLDLMTLDRRPAPRMLVMDDGLLRGGDQLREKLVGLGAEVVWTRHSGQKFLLMVPHRATLPDGSINAIATWLGTVPADETIESSAPPSTAFTERPVRFGGASQVFGIMVPPAPGAPFPRPAVLLLNAGCVNRTGPHRLYVTMARRWAALGFPVLRIDLAGIGDTPASPNTPENLVYPRDGLAEIGLALDFLQAETGTDRLVMVGLCSGADLAFQAAQQGRRLEGVVMMNPRTFLELNLGRVESPTAHSATSDDASIAEALRVTAGLGEISRRGTDALLVVSRPDPGIDFVDRHAAGAMREAEGLPRFRRIDVPGTDHTFTTVASQKRVLEAVTDHLLAHDKSSGAEAALRR